jgi:hypothetical protein
MTQRRTRRALFAILATLFLPHAAAPAQALLIDRGTETQDPRTGFSWLDPTESTNISFNQMQSRFGAGQ